MQDAMTSRMASRILPASFPHLQHLLPACSCPTYKDAGSSYQHSFQHGFGHRAHQWQPTAQAQGATSQLLADALPAETHQHNGAGATGGFQLIRSCVLLTHANRPSGIKIHV
jgi:hypothetical protein